MAQITVRGLDSDLENDVRRRARESGKSVNRVIIDILMESTGRSKGIKRRPADSLRELAGGWSEAEAGSFIESIRSCEQIDEEMWK
ncbi:MAG: hypothetical protein C4576_30055 [Desulfobacteraceae bacterium]|nr:MAG: hypothetical protein C4576_30055 [Desulfobacteraceae bacterium]